MPMKKVFREFRIFKNELNHSSSVGIQTVFLILTLPEILIILYSCDHLNIQKTEKPPFQFL